MASNLVIYLSVGMASVVGGWNGENSDSPAHRHHCLPCELRTALLHIAIETLLHSVSSDYQFKQLHIALRQKLVDP
jgi:hypothetical protein